MNTPVLEVQGLVTTLGHKGQGPSILEDVSLQVAAGEVLGVVGESGSGKSMLALAIMGLLPSGVRIGAGSIRLRGSELTTGSASAWRAHRGREMAMVFQEPMSSLNPVMRIGAQIEETLRRRLGMRGDAATRRALDLMERVEIPSARSRLAAYPHEMSGGMRQRVMIAMALACGPQLLIADEPTTALDVTIQAQILDLLRAIQRDTGMALMLITHDLGVIAEVADRVLVLYAGRVAETAPVRELFDAPAHPYTRALLRSVPRMSSRVGRLVTIDGSVPGVGAMPPGCRFAPRCGLRTDACEAAPPASAMLGPDHSVACLHVEAAGAPAPRDLEAIS
ncbi:MAG: Oligopeptide/dipeptide transporter, ATP-binding protein-like [Ramlibacter sp.]|nr:Oligopeptide/dipeptide transporter, ATP-binding protein-like [Ramlibacter sp.]